ncbi:hypothetical protein H1O16_gp195 [Burkholderia phage BcepSaruman]|uniref:Uncharacterized protein n=1 Tax=Burkholderia phage BcepSaruman TaxID=2530032 RepID=A0A4D5ZHR6_9CAUD|nr:hypothetical protein H1O16_gp195 [Burkholderia phage BcepSaruman]QBX06608.1 hypothetical protein BcepSaruman_195 [Burkholderia phage BcepSaruman]
MHYNAYDARTLDDVVRFVARSIYVAGAGNNMDAQDDRDHVLHTANIALDFKRVAGAFKIGYATADYHDGVLDIVLHLVLHSGPDVIRIKLEVVNGKVINNGQQIAPTLERGHVYVGTQDRA